MPAMSFSFLLVFTVLLVLTPSTYAFGAGDIPDFAYLNDKAFRHGDIEAILETLVKNVGSSAAGGGLLSFATSVLESATGGAKFNKMDIKRVYFGNWLRDYSQAMDIAGLSKLTADTITLIVSILGFMTFGYATEEFEVTQERLGVYLPVEHIDNPRGYAEKEGDARQINSNLRPPVDPRELEIDERTGMKNYMASDNQGWDTSTAFIRRTLKACIEHGRRAGGQENGDLFEAYRLLGTGLHTLEDLLAHSNWCEIALRKMGHEEVFCHVGDNVIVETPNGPCPPLVTGTFGGADFLHSVLGEAGDHLSQASVTELTSKMNEASQGEESNISAFKDIIGKLPMGGNDDKVNQGDQMQQQSKAYNFDPNDIAPPEVQRNLIDVLKWRDSIVKDITQKMDMVPGLSDLIDELTNALNAYVYTILAPYVVPLITSATGILDEGSKEVINNSDQYQVFDDPDASDPSHSILSKDHFALILNEPAGKIAQVIDEYAVNLIVRAWSDDSDPDSVLDAILEAFHHPYYATGSSQIQNKMFEHMEMWFGGLGSEVASQVIQRLTKESVREHNNKRIGSEDMNFEEPGYAKHQHGSSQGYTQNNQYSGSTYSGNTQNQGRSSGNEYNQEYDTGRNNDSYTDTYRRESDNSYSQDRYSSQRPEYENRTRYEEGNGQESYEDNNRRQTSESYGSRDDNYQRQHQSQGYAPSYEQTDSYGSQREEYLSREGYGDQREEYRSGQSQGYGDGERYGGQSEGYGGGRSGGQSEESGSRQRYDGQGEEYGTRERYGRSEEFGNTEGYGGRGESYVGSSEGYEGGGYGARTNYNPSYGGDETFGAERLNLGENEDDNRERRHGHGHHHHHHEYSDD
ncbi:hypothetical protein AGABI1DRAFT_110607 [Agaricus bisporus var. burnettii JB137-S8]|uniref:Het-C-domain-containing protein n=1 Tax=Agaricus bisporus var. burnettii (strain JB137-S8 / ATCC MYA-4627 / FGSC 10392) TaxID=597362 RepID=K5XKE2_AGABU|nr:uncharacterized protein AGABI1DRAFT_110607 [Agaricus bisporus var. burnettii JB137-S8]EKM84003.1 hypothetical protein AGABI1DRAFT_110607 [Agaricus bisporus var. burnettii JB137-S8]